MLKKIALVALSALLVGALAPLAHSDESVLMLVRVPVTSDRQAGALMARFDESHNHGNGYVELLLWPGDRERLDSMGVHYEIVEADLVAHDRALARGPQPVISMPGPDRSDYRRYIDYQTELQQLADDYPKLVKLITMPEPTLEGRTVYGVEIAADVKAADGRPTAYFDGVHHAREWPAGEFPMTFAYYLVEGFEKGQKSVVKLLKESRVVIVPIVNADGFDYSRESLLQVEELAAGNGFEGYWRKNRRSLTGVTVPVAQRNPDAYGVDPNRNYPYLWGDTQGGSSGSQVDQTYRGGAPFSEPETRNVGDLVHHRPVTMVSTNHTFQGSVLRPGGPGAPDYLLLEKIGLRTAELMGNDAYDSRESVGYPTTGTTDDWTYAAFGTIGFTIEHGRIGFHPPYVDGVGNPLDGVMKGFFYLAQVGADPRYHSVLTGKVAGGNAKLTITKTFDTPLSPGNPLGEESFEESLKFTLTTDRNGTFEWHLPPSTRPFADGKESYKLKIAGAGGSTTINVFVKRGQVLDLGTIKL